MKKVSVIIPCYNQSEYIEEAILSVVNQTYPNIEIICIDDCSSDNSAQIIKSLVEQYKNIVFLSNIENVGVVKSRNKAVEVSTGQYILPLDGDDIISESYIEKAVKILTEHRRQLDVLAQYLYQHETITGDMFMKLLQQTGTTLLSAPTTQDETTDSPTSSETE